METKLIVAAASIGVCAIIISLFFRIFNIKSKSYDDFTNNAENNPDIDIINFNKKVESIRGFLRRKWYFRGNRYIFTINRNTIVYDSINQMRNISIDKFKYQELQIEFENEQGIDAGGLTREWINLVVNNILNPEFGLFIFSSGSNSKILPFHCSNKIENHLEYFYFIGRILAKILIEGYSVNIPFERSVFNYLLGYENTLEDIKIIDQELYASYMKFELLICGSNDIDVDDWIKNTKYTEGFSEDDINVIWFWKAVRSFTLQEKSKLLMFCTGSPRVPFGGFKNLVNKGEDCVFTIRKSDKDLDGLPEAHTCINWLVMPKYSSYEVLREKVLYAINECEGGFLFV
ncbi:ubiquitin-protein ligase [Vairimorpha apis BRL 01]|uniref:HECT-type E3 ubiquitin transferase n=1 Tax=Vairimorpha apis BRL 01 TaxID=1037528 RepID=T0L6F5_9MICR|nr:ubiquitin-protein ligase [Vairimorpha apis BRL 01]